MLRGPEPGPVDRARDGRREVVQPLERDASQRPPPALRSLVVAAYDEQPDQERDDRRGDRERDEDEGLLVPTSRVTQAARAPRRRSCTVSPQRQSACRSVLSDFATPLATARCASPGRRKSPPAISAPVSPCRFMIVLFSIVTCAASPNGSNSACCMSE